MRIWTTFFSAGWSDAGRATGGDEQPLERVMLSQAAFSILLDCQDLA
ncbi:MAG: hypothetical protein U0232_18445 [Thermomicrobiales bacterium]